MFIHNGFIFVLYKDADSKFNFPLHSILQCITLWIVLYKSFVTP